MYDPVTGGFTQPDSIVPGALNPAAWNRYSYVYGNPANYTDPSGHCPICIGIGIGALIGGGIGARYAYNQGYDYSTPEFWQYTAAGAVIGGATSGLLGVGAGFTLAPLTYSGAVFGGAINSSLYLITTIPTNNFSYGGLAGAFVGGAITGGIGTIATPIAVSLGFGTGIAGTFAVNATAGLIAGVASATLDPDQDLTLAYALSSAIAGSIGGYIGAKIFPTKGMSNFRQVGFPRTWRGITPRFLGGKAGFNARAAIYRGGAVSAGLGFAGPYLTNKIIELINIASGVYENIPISPISPISPITTGSLR